MCSIKNINNYNYFLIVIIIMKIIYNLLGYGTR